MGYYGRHCGGSSDTSEEKKVRIPLDVTETNGKCNKCGYDVYVSEGYTTSNERVFRSDDHTVYWDYMYCFHCHGPCNKCGKLATANDLLDHEHHCVQCKYEPCKGCGKLATVDDLLNHGPFGLLDYHLCLECSVSNPPDTDKYQCTWWDDKEWRIVKTKYSCDTCNNGFWGYYNTKTLICPDCNGHNNPSTPNNIYEFDKGNNEWSIKYKICIKCRETYDAWFYDLPNSYKIANNSNLCVSCLQIEVSHRWLEQITSYIQNTGFIADAETKTIFIDKCTQCNKKISRTIHNLEFDTTRHDLCSKCCPNNKYLRYKQTNNGWVIDKRLHKTDKRHAWGYERVSHDYKCNCGC